MNSAKLLRALVCAAALGAGAAGAQEITLKVSHFWPPQAMPPTKVLQPWCAKIQKESNGRLKCQIFPAMQLGGAPAQLYDQAKDGIADIVFTLLGYTPGRFPRMEVFELPFMTANAEQTSRAVWDYYEQYARDEFPGVKVLALNVHDKGFIHTRERQIKTPADLKGLKMRAPSRQTTKMMQLLGASAVAMPLPQVTDALSKGVIDGFILPWEVIPAIKAHELVKYHTETDPQARTLYTVVFTIAMNPKRYESLPPDLKKVIDDNSGREFSASIGRAWDESAPAGRKFAEARGNVFYTIPAAELVQWEKALAPLYDDWVNDMNTRGHDGKKLLEAARTLIRKYETR
jgi:TRAP-type C4-dicarboxylate transport system substrate-binding protein